MTASEDQNQLVREPAPAQPQGAGEAVVARHTPDELQDLPYLSRVIQALQRPPAAMTASEIAQLHKDAAHLLTLKFQAAAQPASRLQGISNVRMAEVLTTAYGSPEWTMDDVRAARAVESATLEAVSGQAGAWAVPEDVWRDADRYRSLEAKAAQKTAYDMYGNGGHWSVGFFSQDSRMSFGEAVDAMLRAAKGEQ